MHSGGYGGGFDDSIVSTLDPVSFGGDYGGNDSGGFDQGFGFPSSGFDFDGSGDNSGDFFSFDPVSTAGGSVVEVQRDPSVPNAFEGLINPQRNGPFISTMPLAGPSCTVICVPDKANLCSANSGCRVTCGPVVGLSR